MPYAAKQQSASPIGLDVGLALLSLEAGVLILQPLVLFLESAYLYGQLLHEVQKPDDALPGIGVASPREVKVFKRRQERRLSRARVVKSLLWPLRARSRPRAAPIH